MQALQLRDTLRHYTGVKRHIATGFVLLLGICWGCGTGEYERRLEARIAELKTESKFKYLASAVDVPGTRVSIRIPQDFNNTSLIEGAMIDGKPVDARRLK